MSDWTTGVFMVRRVMRGVWSLWEKVRGAARACSQKLKKSSEFQYISTLTLSLSAYAREGGAHTANVGMRCGGRSPRCEGGHIQVSQPSGGSVRVMQSALTAAAGGVGEAVAGAICAQGGGCKSARKGAGAAAGAPDKPHDPRTIL